MARGNKKQQSLKDDTKQSAPQVDISKALAAGIDRAELSKPIDTPEISRAAQYLIDNQDKMKAFKDFLGKTSDHLGGSGKGLRERIVMYFNRLPKEIQDAITEPKDFISKLYRGSSHPANPGPGGEVNAGFSTFISTARAWTYNGTTKYGKKEEGIYTKDQIESFDHIISFKKIGSLLAKYNEASKDNPGAEKIPNKIYDESDTPHSAHLPGGPGGYKSTPEHFIGWAALEDEHLVTNIKWKPGSGVEARRNRLRFDRKYPDWGEESTRLSADHKKKWMPY